MSPAPASPSGPASVPAGPATPHRPGTRAAGRVVVLVSGAGTNLAALLAAHDAPGYPARVVGVVSDRGAAGGLELARDAGVPTAVVAPGEFEDRAAWDRALADAIGVFRPDLVVSAGFMRILGAPVLQRWENRVVNTHPALLPSFPGAHAVRDALAFGAKVTGCTLHVVDAGVDTGPVVAQVAVPVLDGDDEPTLHERIKVAERELLVTWVGRLVAEGMRVEGRSVTVGLG
ncbi:phosphoribosylglycinamide formyltransferase [Cellulomonas sp. C5510]|uniref:phosphoribosylglycinamide formyltransferase n=1 Tax=Cellulomonas sp. C5510 TaxID=2871170 RepID=UPI001C94084B|nr:phosphoribosylglycinamide formyltransferase [Cellulomonas sp. C5510]